MADPQQGAVPKGFIPDAPSSGPQGFTPDTLLDKPKTTSGGSVVFPNGLPTIDDIGNAITNFTIGTAKGTGRTLIDLAKMSENLTNPFGPSVITSSPDYERVKQAYQPNGLAETIGSYAPDVLLSSGIGKLASGSRYLPTKAANLWMNAAERPMSETTAHMAEDVLGQGVGKLTRANAQKYLNTGPAARLNYGRAEALADIDAAYAQGNKPGLRILGMPTPINPAVVKSGLAQTLYSSAPAIQAATGGGGALVADLLARWLGGGQ